jgi:hypothetical protein
MNTERMGTRLAQINNITSVADHFTWIYTNTTGTAEVGICGKTSGAVTGTWSVDSDTNGRSTIVYMRLP